MGPFSINCIKCTGATKIVLFSLLPFKIIGPCSIQCFSDAYGDKGGGVEDDEAAGQDMVVVGRRDRHAKRAEAYHLVLSRG